MNKHTIEDLLGIELSKMKESEIINVTVKELIEVNNKLLAYGFWIGVGITSLLFILIIYVFFNGLS